MTRVTAAAFDRLSVSKRLRLVQELWDRIAARPEDVPVTKAQRAELDRRLADERVNAPAGVPWATVRRRALRRG